MKFNYAISIIASVSQDKFGNPLPEPMAGRAVDIAQQRMTLKFGGCSATELLGMYHSAQTGKYFVERSCKLESLSVEAPIESEVVDIAQQLKEALGQECVLLEIRKVENAQLIF